MKPVTFFVENQSKFETHKPKYGSNLESSETFKYDSTSYKSIFNLVCLFIILQLKKIKKKLFARFL